MGGETVAIRSEVVNRARLLRGLARLELYALVKCDARTGSRVLNGGRVHIVTARKFAKALNLDIAKVVNLDAPSAVACQG